MKLKIKNFTLSILLSVFMMPLFSMGAYATEVNTVTSVPSKTLQTTAPDVDAPELTVDKNGNYNVDAKLPNVSMDQVSDWANSKGFDVVNLLQTIVQPLSISVFIFSCIVVILGVFGNKGMMAKGFVGLGISVAMYTCVLFAPDLLAFFSQWLSN